MGGVSALMALGLFSLDGGSSSHPCYDITSPLFNEVIIHLDSNYYPGKEFKIVTYHNSKENCYIQKAALNGKEYKTYQLPHSTFANGGVLELWMGDKPERDKPNQNSNGKACESTNKHIFGDLDLFGFIQFAKAEN